MHFLVEMFFIQDFSKLSTDYYVVERNVRLLKASFRNSSNSKQAVEVTVTDQRRKL